jgi:hypothetical protein
MLMGINLHTIQFTNHGFFGVAVDVSKKLLNPAFTAVTTRQPKKLGKDWKLQHAHPTGRLLKDWRIKNTRMFLQFSFTPKCRVYTKIWDLLKFNP